MNKRKQIEKRDADVMRAWQQKNSRYAALDEFFTAASRQLGLNKISFCFARHPDVGFFAIILAVLGYASDTGESTAVPWTSWLFLAGLGAFEIYLRRSHPGEMPNEGEAAHDRRAARRAAYLELFAANDADPFPKPPADEDDDA